MKIIATLFSILFSGLVFSASINKIVVFGDSLSDNGNLYEYMKHQLPISPPYYEGRFTNGPLWIELIAQHYFPTDTNAHLLDYAFGGAGVSGQDAEADDDETLFTLKHEVDSYLLAHQDHADEQTLYVMWMGANNYLALPDDIDQTLEDVNWGIKSTLERLVKKGARHFLILDLPNLSRTPAARDFDAVDLLNDCSIRNNELLKNNVDALKQAYPEVQWIFFEVGNNLDEVLNDPKPYGFTNITDTCYEALIDEHPTKKSLLNMVSSIRSSLRKDACDGYLFFDPVHPAALAHRILADRIIALLQDKNVPFSS